MFDIFTAVADWTTFSFLGLDAGTKIADAVHFFIEDTTKIFFLLVTIVFVMGLFRTLLSPEKVRRFIVGKSHGVGYVLAVVRGQKVRAARCDALTRGTSPGGSKRIRCRYAAAFRS